MARNKLIQAALLATADDTEQHFYDALQHGDVERMMACWAEDDEVASTLIDGLRAHGLAAVRQQFEGLMAGGSIEIHPVRVRRCVLGGCAIHHVLVRMRVDTTEGPQQLHVVTTNVYVNTPQGWRIVTHHASLGQPGDVDDSAASQFGSLLH